MQTSFGVEILFHANQQAQNQKVKKQKENEKLKNTKSRKTKKQKSPEVQTSIGELFLHMLAHALVFLLLNVSNLVANGPFKPPLWTHGFKTM